MAHVYSDYKLQVPTKYDIALDHLPRFSCHILQLGAGGKMYSTRFRRENNLIQAMAQSSLATVLYVLYRKPGFSPAVSIYLIPHPGVLYT